MSTPNPPVIPAQAWRVLAVTSLGVFIVFLDTTIVNVAFQTIKADFHASQSGLSWVLNAYALVFAALLVPAGRLADQVGRRRVYVAGLAIFAVTSAACGLAPGTGLLVAARALQAVGAALVVPTSLALLLPAFPLAKRSTAVGLWGAMGAVAAASGPTIGALLIRYVDWRAVFLVNVPVCLLAGVLVLRVVEESRDPAPQPLPAVPGVLLVVAAPGLLALGIVQGPDWGWGSWRVVAAFAVGALLLVALLAQSRTTARPVVDPALFAVRSYSVANTGTLLFGTAFFAATLANIVFLQTVWHWSVLRAALAVTPGPLTAAAFAGPAGRLADRYGHRVVLVPGALVFAASQLQLAARVGAQPSYVAVWLPSALLAGVGIGLTLPTLGSAAASSLPPARFGVGAAVNSTFRQLGAVLGVSLFVAVLGHPGPLAALAAFDRSWEVTAGVSAAAGVVCLGLRGTSARQRVAAHAGVGGSALAAAPP